MKIVTIILLIWSSQLLCMQAAITITDQAVLIKKQNKQIADLQQELEKSRGEKQKLTEINKTQAELIEQLRIYINQLEKTFSEVNGKQQMAKDALVALKQDQ